MSAKEQIKDNLSQALIEYSLKRLVDAIRQITNPYEGTLIFGPNTLVDLRLAPIIKSWEFALLSTDISEVQREEIKDNIDRMIHLLMIAKARIAVNEAIMQFSWIPNDPKKTVQTNALVRELIDLLRHFNVRKEILNTNHEASFTITFDYSNPAAPETPPEA